MSIRWRELAGIRRLFTLSRSLTQGSSQIHQTSSDMEVAIVTDDFSDTPPPPYYAVIFTSRLSHNDGGYAAMGDSLAKLAESQPGYLGMETTRGNDRVGITVSYWKDEGSILAWKADMKHLLAQKIGIERWYEHYELRVARVERAYSGPKERSVGHTPPGN